MVVTIEVRQPRNKNERGNFGITWAKKDQAVIFINAAMNKNRKELIDTLMHECYHAVVGMFGFSNKHEEQIAKKVGALVR